MLVIVAPGQGAQAPGFLEPWLEDPTFAERMRWLSAVADLDLVHYGTKADADTIRDTAVAQPLLVASALVTSLQLFPHPAEGFARIGAVAGHSVGELAAAAGSRAISAEQAMVLVRERGKAMARAAAETPTSMTAVLGGDRDEVLGAIERHGLTAANDNGPGQIVAAGTVEQLAAFADDAPERARLTPLSVAGAFHTHHMQPAVAVLDGLAAAVSTHAPRTPVISNRDGHVVQDGDEVLSRIVSQIGSPVRWDLCMETMLDLGVTGMLELPPAGVLSGIARRGMKGVATFALKTPDQLDEARAFVEEHGTPSPLETAGGAVAERVVVSPLKGTFSPSADLAEGNPVPAESPVGTVSGPRGDVAVSAPRGTVVEWLVRDGDEVAPAQPLLRIHPEGVSA